MENERCVIFDSKEINVEDYPHVSSSTGISNFQQPLLDDKDTGMVIKYLRYPKGCIIPRHTHTCSHGYYVLKGTLTTSEGDYGPGSFVWFKEGAEMWHGAGDEDMDAIFITNKAFGINYLK